MCPEGGFPIPQLPKRLVERGGLLAFSTLRRPRTTAVVQDLREAVQLYNQAAERRDVEALAIAIDRSDLRTIRQAGEAAKNHLLGLPQSI